jgi:hypothetical protein
MATIKKFVPTDTDAIGAALVGKLLEFSAEPLGQIESFRGAGVYAIYYVGPFRPYAVLAEANRRGALARPIYIGKARPAGARTGGTPGVEYTGTALFKRLREHAASVSATTNLDVKDFLARYLVLDDIWTPLAEALLITRFSPIWNSLIPGFGNHNPGKGRHAGMVSRWDVIHPGRPWVVDFQPRAETADQIASEIESHLRLGANPSASR